MRATLFVLVLAACGKSADAPTAGSATAPAASGDVVKGTVSIDGTAIAASDLQCKPGAAVHIFVDVVTPKGTLHVEDGKLALDGEPLTCEKFERSWGGGRRPDSAYWRGTLSFACVHGTQKIVGDLDLDCGGITAEERASLDANRKKTLDAQKSDGPK